MNLLYYTLVKESIWDQIKEEFEDILKMLEDLFLMIKEVTYDNLANWLGGDVAMLLVITVGVIGLMLILLAVINR